MTFAVDWALRTNYLSMYLSIYLPSFSGLLTEPREDLPVDDSPTVWAGPGPSDEEFSDWSDAESRGIHNERTAEVSTFSSICAFVF